MKNLHTYLAFLFFMSLSAVGLANIAYWALKGEFWITFASCFAGWTGYLLAHYSVEGEFIDGNEDDTDHKIRTSKHKEILGIALGSAVLISGMGVGVNSLSISNLRLTVLAALIFHAGYVITHYSATGELV